MKAPDYSIPVPQNPALQDYMMMYAVAQFNRHDQDLLTQPFDRLMVSARIAFYLQFFLWMRRIEDYVVDMEYGRLVVGVDITAKKTRQRPHLGLDILIRKRGDEAAGIPPVNVLCAEVKAAGKQEGNKAEENRLQKLTDTKWDFHYPSGYILRAEFKGENRTNLRIKWVFRGGEKVDLLEPVF